MDPTLPYKYKLSFQYDFYSKYFIKTQYFQQVKNLKHIYFVKLQKNQLNFSYELLND